MCRLRMQPQRLLPRSSTTATCLKPHVKWRVVRATTAGRTQRGAQRVHQRNLCSRRGVDGQRPCMELGQLQQLVGKGPA